MPARAFRALRTRLGLGDGLGPGTLPARTNGHDRPAARLPLFSTGCVVMRTLKRHDLPCQAYGTHMGYDRLVNRQRA